MVRYYVDNLGDGRLFSISAPSDHLANFIAEKLFGKENYRFANREAYQTKALWVTLDFTQIGYDIDDKFKMGKIAFDENDKDLKIFGDAIREICEHSHVDYAIDDNGRWIRNVYYNPDSVSGGQLVIDVYDKTDLCDYLDEKDYVNNHRFSWVDFSDNAHNYCLDLDSPEEILTVLNSNYIARFYEAKDEETILENMMEEYYVERGMANITNHQFQECEKETIEELMKKNYNPEGLLESIILLYDNHNDEGYKAGLSDAFEQFTKVSLSRAIKDAFEPKREKGVKIDEHQMIEEMRMDPLQQLDDLER